MTKGRRRTTRDADHESFDTAYDAIMARWPDGTESLTVPTPYGPTRVHACGPRGAPPLVLLPGGGATSAGWYALAAELSKTHRVFAVDLVGDAGHSAPDPQRPVRSVGDLTAWLDALLDGLSIGLPSGPPVDLCGHSYGAWIALHYALHAPTRVRRTVLLDPTGCFAGFRASYLLRALPMLLRPSARRVRRFLEWETAGGAPLDPALLRLQERAAVLPAVRPVTGPRPDPAALRGLRCPVLLLLAGDGRAHDPHRVAARASAVLPEVTATVLPGVSHHVLPYAMHADVHGRTAAFLGPLSRPSR
ncbi:alpha/beta fold hydrolase [Streptomyces sp. NPDC091292]|uniref:alpha/beta fold hydrolase n=1 Tax=Streptomyces sp. NPDC091292 TaxID=3365991 RepID=UPI0038199E65